MVGAGFELLGRSADEWGGVVRVVYGCEERWVKETMEALVARMGFVIYFEVRVGDIGRKWGASGWRITTAFKRLQLQPISLLFDSELCKATQQLARYADPVYEPRVGNS